jgi:hypothetical protein
VGVKAKRSDHAHRDTANEGEHGWTEMKLNEISKFHQHHEQSEQHHVEHAPFAKMFHQSERECFMSLSEQLQTGELEQKDDLRQWKDDRKQEQD